MVEIVDYSSKHKAVSLYGKDYSTVPGDQSVRVDNLGYQYVYLGPGTASIGTVSISGVVPTTGTFTIDTLSIGTINAADWWQGTPENSAGTLTVDSGGVVYNLTGGGARNVSVHNLPISTYSVYVLYDAIVNPLNNFHHFIGPGERMSDNQRVDSTISMACVAPGTAYVYIYAQR